MALRVALIATVFVEVCDVFAPFFGSTEVYIKFIVGRQGINFAARIAWVVGALVQIVPIRRRVGSKLIGAGEIMSLLSSCFYFTVSLKQSWMPSWGQEVMPWGWFGFAVAVGAGLVWIAWKKPGIAKYAANTGAVELEGKARRLIWLVVILQFLSTLMQLRRGEARGSILLLTVLLVISGTVVIASMARVAGAAAESIADEAQPDLPVAKLI